MIDSATVKSWGGWILGGAGFIGMIWNRLGIHSLDVRTDGLTVKWVAAEKAKSRLEGEREKQTDFQHQRDLQGEQDNANRTRADRAEARLDEQSDVRHRERNRAEAENHL
jgi:hypothetical protein